MPSLKMLRGPSPGEEFNLNQQTMTIGRGHKNHIIIQDNEVSRTHCRLVRVLEDYEIHDLGSTNGTFVNGQRIDEGGWLLSGRSIVELGDSITLEYQPQDVATGTLPTIPSDAQQSVFYLVIQQRSQDKPEIYILDRVTITIGRDVDNDISLDEPEVSRHHMRLVLTKDGYMLEDLNTMNGTAIGGESLTTQQLLHPNNEITVGMGVTMWYTDDPDYLLTNISDDALPDSHTTNDPNPSMTDEVTHDRSVIKPEAKTDAVIQIGHGLSNGDLENTLFMTYAREEWNVIGRHVYAYLDDNNIKTHTQQYLTPNTDDWRIALEQAHAESPCLLAIISAHSITMTHVIRSIRHFIAREKPVLLVQYGKIDKLPMIIRNMPAIRFDPQNPDKTYRIILAELRRIGL
ncbi:MAG: FHA domain-containing protein [Anaerolineae bacterium]